MQYVRHFRQEYPTDPLQWPWPMSDRQKQKANREVPALTKLNRELQRTGARVVHIVPDEDGMGYLVVLEVDDGYSDEL